MITLDRSSVAVGKSDGTDPRTLFCRLGAVRELPIAQCETQKKADELARLLTAGHLDRLEVRETELKVNIRYELVIEYAGDSIVLAEFRSENDADLWAAVVEVADGDALPALPSIPGEAGQPIVTPELGDRTLMDALDPRAQRSA